MARIPIAVQLFSVRNQCADDLPGTLKAVADMGYEGVEPAGYHGCNAREWRQMLDDLGLKAAGTHLQLDHLLGEELKRTVDFNQIIGNKNLIVASLPEQRRSSKEEWLSTAWLMNDIAEKVKIAGMRVGYHNHGVEFTPLDGEMPWDIFFGAASPDIIMQLDSGNAARAGVDVVPYVERYPGRATTVHLKEYSATDKTALIGEGDVPWEELFRLCESAGGTEWYIVEHEAPAFPPLECVKRCLENLKAMGK